MASHRDPITVGRGTRFRLFAQDPALAAFREPETVWIARAPGTIAPGPADERMYVIDAIGKPGPYEYPYLPPYVGPAFPPAVPGPDGHFDHLEVDSPAFRAAHMYGTVRRVLDIWEGYAGHRIEWHFRASHNRLELVPYVDWANAQSGFGFIETGYARDERGVAAPPLAELRRARPRGGAPPDLLGGRDARRRGARTDQVLRLSRVRRRPRRARGCLHFHTVLDHVLRRSAGNLYYLTELSRIGELSETAQIRIADNDLRMSDVEDFSRRREYLVRAPRAGTAADGCRSSTSSSTCTSSSSWTPGSSAPSSTARRAGVSGVTVDDPAIEARFAAAYEGRHDAFKAVLLEARDYLGTGLAHAWRRLSPDYLSYLDVLDALLAVDRYLTGGRFARSIWENFAWREIDARAREPRPGPGAAVRRRATRPGPGPSRRSGTRATDVPRPDGGRNTIVHFCPIRSQDVWQVGEETAAVAPEGHGTG